MLFWCLSPLVGAGVSICLVKLAFFGRSQTVGRSSHSHIYVIIFSKPNVKILYFILLGQRRYCACLTFLEPYKPKDKRSNSSQTNEDKYDDFDELCNDYLILNDQTKNYRRKTDKNKSKPIEPCKLYAAKSLVLVSRLEYVDLFKSCLSLIYAVYVDKRYILNSNNKLLESIIANLLTTQVNAPGKSILNFYEKIF